MIYISADWVFSLLAARLAIFHVVFTINKVCWLLTLNKKFNKELEAWSCFIEETYWSGINMKLYNMEYG